MFPLLIELHHEDSGEPVWINVTHIDFIETRNERTVISVLPRGGNRCVRETPEEIARLVSVATLAIMAELT